MTATTNGAFHKALITQNVSLLQTMVILASLPSSPAPAHFVIAKVKLTVMTLITKFGAISSEEHMIVIAIVSSAQSYAAVLIALLVKVQTNVGCRLFRIRLLSIFMNIPMKIRDTETYYISF